MNAVDKNWSWIVLFGAFLANLLAGGIIFSFGILYTDFIDRLETDALPTAIIGGLAFACSCFVAPFSRTMTLKLGYRFVTVLGAVIAFLGLLLCCFAPSIHYYYVFFGVLCGCGFGLITIASFLAVEDYFHNVSTIVLTIASCGFPVGVVLLPLITRALLDTYSFFGAFMLLSGLMLNCVVCGLLFKPLEKNTAHDSYKQMINPIEAERSVDVEGATDETFPTEEESEIDSEESPDDETMKIKGPKTTRYKSLEETIVVPIGEPLRFDLTAREEITDDSSDDDEPALPPAKKLDEPKRVTKEVAEPTPSVSSHPRQPHTAVEEKKEPKENVKTLLNVIIGVDRGSMLCDARIILYLIASVLFSMGIGIPFCFYPDVSRQYGFSDTKAEWTLSLIGLGSCIGVVFSGFFRQILSNKLDCVSRMLVFVTLLFAGLAVGFVHYYTTYGVLLFSALLFGIFYSTFYFLRRNIVHEIVSEDYFTSAYYLSYWICGLGYLIGIPISGWFKDTYNTHTWSFVMAAVCFGVGALLIFPLVFMKRKQ